MKLNIFRNPFIDAQVGYFLDSLVDARRKETEAYWRNKITEEILSGLSYIAKEDGGYCHVVHLCEVEEIVSMSKEK